MPSPLGDDDLKVWIVPTPGAVFEPAALHAWLVGALPYFAVPRFVQPVEALPVNALGRAQKFLPRERDNANAWDFDALGYTVTRDRRRQPQPDAERGRTGPGRSGRAGPDRARRGRTGATWPGTGVITEGRAHDEPGDDLGHRPAPGRGDRADHRRRRHLLPPLADGGSWPTWLFVESMELSREGESGGESVGAVRIFRYRMAGIRGASHEQVRELVPDRKFAYSVVGGLPIRNHRADVDLTPLPGGGTEISWAATWESPVPGSGPVYRFVIRKIYENFTAALAKKAAEVAGT